MTVDTKLKTKNKSLNQSGQSISNRKVDNLVPAKDKNPDDLEVED